MKYDHTFEIFGQTFVSSSFGLFMSILLVAGLAMPLLTIGLFKIFSFVSDLIEKTKNKYKAMQHQKQLAKQIDSLIAQAKGKFFTLKFIKKDGTLRTINGKDRYNRLVKGTGSPATKALKEQGYKNAINRNGESWVSFKPEKVVEFKCGALHKTF
jgi:hypothetical protein